jgi:hypothetical protein
MRYVGTVSRGASGLALWFVAATAGAQMNPELGDMGDPAGAPMGGPPMGGPPPMQGGAQMQGGWGAPPPAAPAAPEFEAPEEPAVPGSDDHAAVAGHFGVGFFGVMSIPVMGCSNDPACMLVTDQEVSAPTVGLRYWLDEGMAIEGALGLGIASNSLETTVGGTATTIPVESTTAFALHGGVPIALAHSGHFVFEIVPQLNFGIAMGSLEDTMTPGNTWDLSGMLIEIGGRVGAEVHFGFIDIPQLALQGTLGLGLRLESRSAEQTASMTTNDAGTTSIGTSVGDEPWDIFTGGITAIYYFID